jgi:hypothetical protein
MRVAAEANMSLPEWVEPHLATHRLAQHWDIPSQIAEQFVRGALRSGDVLVRGRGFGDNGRRIISKEIGATLNPRSLISWEFSDVEIEWNDLLKHGRNLVPPEWEYWVVAAIEKHSKASKARCKDIQSRTQHNPRPKAKQNRRNRRHGPKRGSVGYSQSDQELYPEIEHLIPEHGSARAAALTLVDAGKVAGRGSSESKAKRLTSRFLKARRRRNSLKISETL